MEIYDEKKYPQHLASFHVRMKLKRAYDILKCFVFFCHSEISYPTSHAIRGGASKETSEYKVGLC